MKRDKINLVLVLLCFCAGSLCNPTSKKSNDIGVLSYKGHIDTSSSASDEKLARWTVSAKLHQLYNDDDGNSVFQLVNIKTSLFNGNRSNLNDALEKEIPAEASKFLEEPFLIKYAAGDAAGDIYFKPNEPLWSVNMKKGIAEILNFEFERPYLSTDGSGVKTPVQKTYKALEQTIYGKCMQEYSRVSESIKDKLVIYQRKMDSLECKEQAIKHITNTIKAPGVKHFSDMIDFDSKKTLTVKLFPGEQEDFMVSKIEAKSRISYKPTPSSLYTLYVDEEQSISYEESIKPNCNEDMDLSVFSEHKSNAYEFGPTSGRHVYEKDSAKLVKQFYKHYDEFNKGFKYAPVEDDVRSSDSVLDMYDILYSMDVDGFKMIEKMIEENDDNFDYGYFYASILPYIGTNATVEYLTNLYKSEKIRANEAFASRVLVTFPQHIQEPSDDKLVEMEGLMNNPHAQKKSTKHSAIFGFASAVATSCRHEAISKKYKHKYIDMFHTKYLEGENYEEKMVYLLGLVNMAECLDFDFMNSITTNSSESGNLRAFAINGFKKYLINDKNTDKVYEIYWPIVQKSSEPLDVRVAALDLLLSAPLSGEQFSSVIQKYSDDLNEPNDKQLANYLLTTLHAIQNSTGYFDNLGALASEAIKSANIHRVPNAWSTGRYRLSYTDSVPNFGTAFEARVITNEETYLMDTLEITYNSFANIFDFGTYVFHLKIEGLYDQMILVKYLARHKHESLPQLLKLLKDNNYKIREFFPDNRIDLVVFKNNMAIYATHSDPFGPDELLKAFEEVVDLAFLSKYFTFPVNDYVHIPSKLGTPILFSNYLMEMSIADVKDGSSKDEKSIKYRSAWSYQTWVEAYNPLADANIATYKSYNDETNVNLNVSFALFTALKWKNEKETYSNTWDNNIGTTVEEEEKLKEYCATCVVLNELETENYASWTNNFEPFGVDCHMVTRNHGKYINRGNVITELWTENLHRYNADAVVYAGPFLFAADVYNYHFWLRSDVSKGSVRSKSINGEDEISETTVELNQSGYTRSSFKAQTLADVKAYVTVRNIEDEIISFANLTVIYDWDPDFVAENATENTGNKITFFQYVQKPFHKDYSAKICGSGEANFPTLRNDRLSIKPYEDTISETVFFLTKNVDDSECVPEFSYTFKEIFSSIDKKTNTDDQLSKDYKQCTADSKDLKFTAPTKECERVSNRLTEYDNYQILFTTMKHLEDHNETIHVEKPLFEYSRVAEDTLRVKFSGLESFDKRWKDMEFSTELYYPKMTVNPLWLSYSTEEPEHIEYQLATCTITPSTVAKFSNKFVPNQNKEWLAFAECVNSTNLGLLGHTIDDKHVGFTFYAGNTVIVATVKNGHLDVTANGKPITEFYEYYDDDYYKVHFLGDNVIYIDYGLSHHDGVKMEIYYNTEYVFIKTDAQYPRLLCGLCNQEKVYTHTKNFIARFG